MNNRQPFFFDTTLRDGNQALKRPWNTAEKEILFKKLELLGVQGIEVGFSGASDMDFEACNHLAKIASPNTIISGLARAVEKDIIKVYDAIKVAERPRIHIVITMSPFNMQYVLNKTPEQVRKLAIDAVTYAKGLLGNKGDVQFSVEHFGDSMDNIDWIIDSLQDVVKAGASVINLPNTVERYRPKFFIDMVEKVYTALPKDVVISVHCHNDLGMATAATVESYFAGAVQLECCLNGIGERAGNTNLFEVAVALHNSGVDVPLNLSEIYELALTVSEMSKIPVSPLAPLIGSEAFAHRSGMHQDGAVKTKGMQKGAYRPIHPTLIGRKDDEIIGFTSQSGKTAIFEIISTAGYPITMQEAIRIAPTVKKAAEQIGELPTRNIIDIYFDEIFAVKGPFTFVSFEKSAPDTYNLKFKHFDKEYNLIGKGNGPLDACLNALSEAGFKQKLVHYEQAALDEELYSSGATAMSIIHFEMPDGTTILSRGKSKSTARANVKAVFNGLNMMAEKKVEV